MYRKFVTKDLFNEVEAFWTEINLKRKYLDRELLYKAFEMINDNFKKYPILEHININVNVEDGEMEILNISINGYPENIVNKDELDNEHDIEQIFYYVVLERLFSIDHEFIFTKNTTYEELLQAYGYY